MCGATCLTIKNGPRRLIAMTWSQTAASISVHLVSRSGANSAALLTRMSILPKRSMVSATSAFTAVSSLTSVTALATELAPWSRASDARDVLAIGDVGDHQACALGGKRPRVVLADALGAAGNNGDASIQSSHGDPSPSGVA